MNDFEELRQVMATVIKRWWLLVLVTVLAATAGYSFSRRQPKVYRATTKLAVGSFLEASELNRDDLLVSGMLAQTYANLARYQPVLQGAIDTLNLTSSWTGLKKRVNVELVEGAQLLGVSVEASSAEEARVTADEIARQLILLAPTGAQTVEQDENTRFVRQRLETLRAKIEEGQKRLEALVAQKAELTSSLSVEQLQEMQSEINELESFIIGWENSYGQFLNYPGGERLVNNLAVIEPAYASSQPIRPRPRLNMIVAGAVGLALALGLTFVIDFLDDTVRSTDELSQSLNLTTLGTVSHAKGYDHLNGLITVEQPLSPTAEDYRMVRSNYQFLSADQPVQSILVTSSASRDGRSITVANLGVAMAQAGVKTIIVDANLRQPTQHQLFSVTNAAGLGDLLRWPEFEVEGLLRKTSVDHLQVLTSGGMVTNPSELLGSERMEDLLDSLGTLADVIIFDSFPVLGATDAAVLANRVDGVVLVVQSGQTRVDDAKLAIANLRKANAKILGAVSNRYPEQQPKVYRILAKLSSDPARRNTARRRWRWLPFFENN